MKKIMILLLVAFFTNPLIGKSSSPDELNKFSLSYPIKDKDKKGKMEINSVKKKLDKMETPGLLIGFRFMPIISSFATHKIDENTFETMTSVSYGFGGLIGFNINENIGMQAEVIYSTLAQKYKDVHGVNTVKLSYVNIPLLMVLNTNTSSPINFNIAFGPQFGINTGSKFEAGNAGNGTDTIHAILAVKPNDIGLAYGAGIDFGLTHLTRLNLGFRGVYGIIDVSDKSHNLATNEYYILDRAHVKTYSGYIGLTFSF